MTDIVTRLREVDGAPTVGALRREAADEIERLRRDEADIRADERAAIARLIEENEETLTGFTGDDSPTLKLLAYMLTLRVDASSSAS